MFFSLRSTTRQILHVAQDDTGVGNRGCTCLIGATFFIYAIRKFADLFVYLQKRKTTIMKKDSYKVAYNDFRTQFFTVEELLKEVDCGHIAMLPSIEYSNNHWNDADKSHFIETLMVGQPQSALFFDGSQPIWYILTGNKEINILLDFCNGKFRLRALYFYCDLYENKRFYELPLSIQRKILNYRFQVHILNPGSSDPVRYGIYNSILEGPQHQLKNYIRNIIYPKNFKILSQACNEVRPSFINSLHYSLEDIAGHLLVFLMAEKRNFPIPYNYSSNIDLLTNVLLKNDTNISSYIKQTDLVFHLNRAFNIFKGAYPVDILKMDTELALIASGRKQIISFNDLDKYWSKMTIENQELLGYTIGNLYQRLKYLNDKL